MGGGTSYGLGRRDTAAPSGLLSAVNRSSPPMTLEAAAEAFREAMRQTVKRYSLWYFVEGILLVAAGVLAIIYPVISSVSVVFLLGWLLIVSGILQGLSLAGARHVPHFWLQLISVILAVLIACSSCEIRGKGY